MLTKEIKDWRGIWRTDQGYFVEIRKGEIFPMKAKIIDSIYKTSSFIGKIVKFDNEGRCLTFFIGKLIERKRGDDAEWPKLKKENK